MSNSSSHKTQSMSSLFLHLKSWVRHHMRTSKDSQTTTVIFEPPVSRFCVELSKQLKCDVFSEMLRHFILRYGTDLISSVVTPSYSGGSNPWVLPFQCTKSLLLFTNNCFPKVQRAVYGFVDFCNMRMPSVDSFSVSLFKLCIFRLRRSFFNDAVGVFPTGICSDCCFKWG